MNQIPPEEQRAIKEQLGAELSHPLSFQFGEVNLKEPECAYSIDSPEYRAQVDQRLSRIYDLLEKAMGRKLPRPVIDEEIRLKLAIAEALTCLQLNAPGLARDALVRALLPQKPDPAFGNPPF